MYIHGYWLNFIECKTQYVLVIAYFQVPHGYCDDAGPRVWCHHSDNIFFVCMRRYAITVL